MNIKKTKNIALNASVLILSLVVLLLIAEFIVRTLYKQEVVLFPRYHTDAKYGAFTLRRIRPNSEFWHTSRDGSWKFTTNSQGFRNYTNFTYNKPKDVVRILSLGDSHTQGYEVSQGYTYSSVIETYLKSQGVSAEVINAGVSGLSTAEELLLLENEGIKYAPDYVVLGFYANDYDDNIKADLLKLDENNNLLVNNYEHIPGVKIQNFIYDLPFVKWLSENSYFYSILFNTTWSFYKRMLSTKAKERVAEYAISTTNVYSDYQERLTSALIKRMYAFCQANNIKLVILDIPQFGEKNAIKSSYTTTLLPVVKNNSDIFYQRYVVKRLYWSRTITRSTRA